MWQDFLIALVGLSFGLMLFPQLRDVIHGKSVNIYTAGLTTVGLYVFSANIFYTWNVGYSNCRNFFRNRMVSIVLLLRIKQKKN